MMRLRDCVAPWALLTIGLCGCTRTKDVRAEEHATLQETRSATMQRDIVKTVQTGPETITTTTEEFEVGAGSNAQATQADAPANVGQREHRVGNPEDAGVAPRAPFLVKRTVTVDQKGPTVTAIAAEAKGASSAALAATDDKKLEEKTTTRWGPPWWVWALLAAVVAGAAWAAWKFSLPGRVFGWLKKL